MDQRRKIEDYNGAFLAYLPKLIGLIKRTLRGAVCGDPNEAADILQEVWLKGARAWPPRNLEVAHTWLGRIAVNAALNRRRLFKRLPQPLAYLTDDTSPLEQTFSGPAPDDLIMGRELRRAIDELEKRAPKLVAALRLVHLDGYTYTEAARMLGIAVGTAKSNIHKAVAHLQASLSADKAA